MLYFSRCPKELVKTINQIVANSRKKNIDHWEFQISRLRKQNHRSPVLVSEGNAPFETITVKTKSKATWLNHDWLVVSTPLKNVLFCQLGLLFPIEMGKNAPNHQPDE